MIMKINKEFFKYFIPVLLIIFNAGIKLTEANLNYQNIRDPFHSVIKEKEEPYGTTENKNDEKEIQETGDIDKTLEFDLIEKEMSEKLEEIEIAGFFGENKKYLVLFKGDSRIYKEKDSLNMDNNIKIDKIDVDVVNLVADLGNGKRLYKKILFKIK